MNRHARPAFATTILRCILLLAVTLLVAGCGREHAPPPQHAVAIGHGDVCAVCGMYIQASPGPRGEAWVEGRRQPLKFDSTRDFFAYVLQPDHAQRLQALFVQDAAHLDWQHPSNAAKSFIDARTAYYVAWQPLLGSMGPTLAPFAHRGDAEAFVREHGGRVLRFDQVTPQLISLLQSRCPQQGTPAAGLGRGCRVSPRRDMPTQGTTDGMPLHATRH